MDSTRRNFLAASAAAPLVIPQSAFGANEKITYGVIATGGRGRYLNRIFQELGAECVALCDIYAPNLEAAQKDSPRAKPFTDHHELLAMKGIDAVVLAGPDHHHCPHLLAALAAKKDIYAEKPLSKTLEESRLMVDAVAGSKQVVQIGMQRRSSEMIRRAKKLVDDGALGKISHVEPRWHWNVSRPLDNSPLPGKIDWEQFLGNAPKREMEPMRFRRWRVFRDYAGGNMTDQGTHLMDVVQWFTGSGSPRSAIAHGFVSKMAGAEHPDVFTAVFEYPTMIVTWTLDYCNAYRNGWSISFFGDKGTLILDEDGYKLYAEPWKADAPPVASEEAKVLASTHVQNFLDCVRSRATPNCTVQMAAEAVSGPHLGNLAMDSGRRVFLNRDGQPW